MLCAKCGGLYPPDSKFCPHCGTMAVTVEAEIVLPQPMPMPIAMPPASQRYHRPPITPAAPKKMGTLRVPMVILAMMCVIGLLVFALFPEDSTAQTQPQKPFDEPQIRFFTATDGFLDFDASLYYGSSELTVPETVNGETVLYISANCFYDCDELTTVFLPDTLENIGRHAFSNCDSLRGISIPESVTSVGSGAFADCEALEAITIPGNLRYLSYDAFENCDNLKYVFFDGTIDQWESLFHGELGFNATVYCSDGEI